MPLSELQPSTVATPVQLLCFNSVTGGLFRFRLVMHLLSICLGLLLGFCFAHNQQDDVEFWLTTYNKSSLLQKQAIHVQTRISYTIEIRENEQFQEMDGYGFALTGGSAELLLSLPSDIRSKTLKELFAWDGDNIGISVLRVSLGDWFTSFFLLVI